MESTIAVALASALVVYKQFLTKRKEKDTRPKCVLITGAASGLGRAMTLELLRNGDTVVGCDIDAAGLNKLQAEYASNFISLPINVTDIGSIKDGAARLLRFSGQPCLDAIVNCAGVQRGGPMTEMDDGDILLSVQGEYYYPRIINVGSEVSYVNLSALFNGPYALTKIAIEAYTTSLRQELSILGDQKVLVSILCPGPHETQLTVQLPFGNYAKREKSLFTQAITKGEPGVRSYINLFMRPPAEVGRAVFDLVHLIHPPNRLNVNISPVMSLLLFVPQLVLDWLVQINYAC